MKRVTGIGGIFFKAADPEKLCAWYEKHLGLKRQPEGTTVIFPWRDNDGLAGLTIWSLFPSDTRYFEPSQQPFMVNYRVDNLDRLLDTLRAEGIEVMPQVEEYEYGRFAWISDPEGNRIELWEPPKAAVPKSEARAKSKRSNKRTTGTKKSARTKTAKKIKERARKTAKTRR